MREMHWLTVYIINKCEMWHVVNNERKIHQGGDNLWKSTIAFFSGNNFPHESRIFLKVKQKIYDKNKQEMRKRGFEKKKKEPCFAIFKFVDKNSLVRFKRAIGY